MLAVDAIIVPVAGLSRFANEEIKIAQRRFASKEIGLPTCYSPGMRALEFYSGLGGAGPSLEHVAVLLSRLLQQTSPPTRLCGCRDALCPAAGGAERPRCASL